MKKLFTIIALLSSGILFGQTSKWFVTLSAGPAIGGPSAGIKRNMEQCGFDQLSYSSFFGWSGTTQYPVVEKNPAVLVTIGKKIHEFKSLYVSGGVAASGSVTGFRRYGSYNAILWAGEVGNTMQIDYRVWQLSAGYQYHLPRSRAKLGFGPSLSLFQYSEREDGKDHASIVPGVSTRLRLPLGRERKIFGIDFFLEGQVARSARTKAYSKMYRTDQMSYTSVLKEGNASMIQCIAGLSFAFRHPVKKQIK